MTPATRSGRRWFALALPVVLLAAACGGGADDAAGDRPLVVATTTILGDVTGEIAGPDVDVQTLMPRGADPHAFEASAQQAARLREADLVVVNGLGLEEGLIGTLEAAESDGVRVLWLAAQLDPQPLDPDHVDEHDDEGGEGDDGHAADGLDPHVWMDPLRMADGAELIAAELEAAGIPGAGDRAAAYRDRIEALSASIAERIASIPAERRTLVTNHVAYDYYADRYGLELLATVIPGATTAAETSAAEFSRLVALIRDRGVPAVFASTTESAALAETLSGEVGREVAVVRLYTGSLGEDGSGAETYLGMMDVSTDRIVEALS